jgi:hypothetical protein
MPTSYLDLVSGQGLEQVPQWRSRPQPAAGVRGPSAREAGERALQLPGSNRAAPAEQRREDRLRPTICELKKPAPAAGITSVSATNQSAAIIISGSSRMFVGRGKGVRPVR